MKTDKGSLHKRLRTPDSIFVHKALSDAIGQIIYRMEYLQNNIITLVGPTQVGKTTAMKLVEESYSAQVEVGAMRFVRLNLRAGSGNIDNERKIIFQKILDQLAFPGKTYQGVPDEQIGLTSSRIRRSSLTELRVAAERALSTGQITVVIADEAQELSAGVNSFIPCKGQMSVLKDLSGHDNVIVVLVGGYAVMDIYAIDPHLGDRLSVVGFHPYSSTGDGKREFALSLNKLTENIPVKSKRGSMLDWFDRLYEFCCGNIGILQKVVKEIIAEADLMGAEEITEEHVISRTEDVSSREALLEEYAIGLSCFPGVQIFSAEQIISAYKRREGKSPSVGRGVKGGRKGRAKQTKVSGDVRGDLI